MDVWWPLSDEDIKISKYGPELMIRSISLHYILIDRFIFRSNFPGTRLPWECHDQLQVIDVTASLDWNCLSFTNEKCGLKIYQSVKMPWHRHAPTHRLLVQTNWELREGKGDPKVAMGRRSTGKRVKKQIYRIRLTGKSWAVYGNANEFMVTIWV